MTVRDVQISVDRRTKWKEVTVHDVNSKLPRMQQHQQRRRSGRGVLGCDWKICGLSEHARLSRFVHFWNVAILRKMRPASLRQLGCCPIRTKTDSQGGTILPRASDCNLRTTMGKLQTAEGRSRCMAKSASNWQKQQQASPC
jgi:hypothetical protein